MSAGNRGVCCRLLLNSERRQWQRDHNVLLGCSCLTKGPFGRDRVRVGSSLLIPERSWEPPALQMLGMVVAPRNRWHSFTFHILAVVKGLELIEVSIR
jgi:hypothetical protein